MKLDSFGGHALFNLLVASQPRRSKQRLGHPTVASSRLGSWAGLVPQAASCGYLLPPLRG